MGLEEKWGQVIDILQDIIPVYDRVNAFISLGKDTEYRKRGIVNRVHTGDKVLDAGSGFGNMSTVAVSICKDITLVLYDPLQPMLHNTAGRFSDTPSMANGIFEHMPFADGTFDVVMCGYSLRDAINLRVAISEMYRVTKKGGRLIVVDLGKPDNAMIRAGVSFYLRMILPLLALAVGGKRGLKFAALYDTYKRWPTNATLEEMLLEKYERVEFQKGMMGGAVMVAAYK